MKPFTNFMFEVVHLQINVRFLPLANLVFDDVYSPFVEINLENMFQRSLYDYICKLHFRSIICRNKQNKDVRVLFFYPIKKILTLVNILTINQPYKFMVFL
jgi:hypothetical protein